MAWRAFWTNLEASSEDMTSVMMRSRWEGGIMRKMRRIMSRAMRALPLATERLMQVK